MVVEGNHPQVIVVVTMEVDVAVVAVVELDVLAYHGILSIEVLSEMNKCEL